MDDQTPLYNSRIARIYVDLVRRDYPDVNLEPVLSQAGITRLELQDPAHWFSQSQVDRFHEGLVQLTGDPHISRAAGRFAASSQGLGAFKQYMLGFFNPNAIFSLTSKAYPLMSRGVAVETLRLKPNRIQIIARPNPGVDEKPFQCENRIGFFESICHHFSGNYPQVEHPACMHRGDGECRYIVNWARSPALIWRRLRNAALALDVLLVPFLPLLGPLSIWLPAMLALLLLTAAISLYGLRLEKRDLTRLVEAQGNAAQQRLDEMNTHYNNMALIQEIGKAAATNCRTAHLFQAVTDTMRKRLDFDRGLIMIADEDQQRLSYAASYGFNPAHRDILQQVSFHLDKPDSRGLFVRSFREQKPFLVDDIQDLKPQFSSRSRDLVDKIGAHSLICVPIVFEQQALGIIAVDTIVSRRKLVQSDLNLLLGVAAQLAMSINNARSYLKLQASEKQYREIFETVSDFLYYHDLDGNLITANRAFKHATRYNDEDLRSLNLRDLIPVRHRDQFVNYMEKVCQRGGFEGVTTLLCKDGREIVVDFKSSALKNAKTSAGIRGSARDITAWWHAQKERKQLESVLERAQKMEALGTLAGGVAHDLNNILTGIVSYPELLLMDLPADSPYREPIQVMQESGQRAAAIVTDLLTMARRGVATTEVVNLGRLVEDYLNAPELKNLKANHPHLQVEVQCSARLLNVMGSPVHMVKTLMNLVNNAAEAMPEGGSVTLTIANAYVDKPIRGYDMVQEGDYVVLRVADTGIGISAEDRQRIFEPFYTKKVMGRSGTGLGMSVVWSTVKDHKGYIDIESEPGIGTVISLYFPATQREVVAKGEQQASERYRGRGERVLVVDDVAEQRHIAARMLERLGYQVDLAENGEKAAAHVADRPVDLVVLDMIMPPGIDGLDTYRRMLASRPGQRAIIASGFSESDRVRQAQRLGAGAYVRKPYLLGTLAQAVRQELDRERPGATVAHPSPPAP